MKIHLAWIRVTAAAAIAASTGAHPAVAQYAPMRPIPTKPAAPQSAPATAAPATPYVAARTPAAYPQTSPYPQTIQAPAAQYQSPAMSYQTATTPTAAYQAPVAQYQAPVTAVAPATPAQAPVAYPQTAMAQYPAVYGGTPYVAQATPPAPSEPLPAPAQPAAPATPAPATGTTIPADGAQTLTGAAPAAGCNCNGDYGAGTYYGAGGGGCSSGYPDLSGYMDDCGPQNIWFGGVYYLCMERDEPSDEQLAVTVPLGTPYPHYPSRSETIVSTGCPDYGYRSGVELRFGSTFTVGGSEACNTCGSGYSYPGCGCNNSCAPSTMYAWEFVWWGLDNEPNQQVFVQDWTLGRLHGMKSFAGLEYDRDGAGGAYTWAPVNNYYGYQMPIDVLPPAPYTVSIGQRVWTDFKAQNLEINVIRFPMMCDACGTGCGGCNNACGYDACGCNTGCTTGGCEDDSPCAVFSMYGSCGVRYFRIDDDFSYDTEFATFDGTTYDHVYDGFSGIPDLFELCYDINIENNLIGPQVGWTTNYCVGCRWNFFCNSTFGIFDNHMTQFQRVWGSGDVRFTGSGESMVVRSKKDDVAFLGELRIGGSYDFTCNVRGVLAYRALGLTGVATSVGQIPDNFSDRADVARIDSDNSMIIHGVQLGAECRY